MSNQYPAFDGQGARVPATTEVTVTTADEVTGVAPRRPGTASMVETVPSYSSSYDSPNDGSGNYVGAVFLG